MQLSEYANQKIKLIQGISGVFHTPYIIEGEISSTGKTIEVEEKHGSRTYRLDTEKILTGGVEVRRATTFKLYTRKNYLSQKRANYDPANYRNTDTDEVAEEMARGDFVKPTHQEIQDGGG
ncbi:hypothetical protein K9M78_01345 [Candidatus Bipolaricaulota bacterium]|nr:hypothetical protein [Candidatus Bipolaricaulota bacterium]